MTRNGNFHCEKGFRRTSFYLNCHGLSISSAGMPNVYWNSFVDASLGDKLLQNGVVQRIFRSSLGAEQ